MDHEAMPVSNDIMMVNHRKDACDYNTICCFQGERRKKEQNCLSYKDGIRLYMIVLAEKLCANVVACA
jgi:hypothetical protein